MTPALLDAATVRAYSRGVMAVTPTDPDDAQARAITSKRYRRPASGARLERLRRQAKRNSDGIRAAYQKMLRAQGER